MGLPHGERPVFGLFGGGSSKKAPETWRDKAASPGQLELAESLGIKVPAGMKQGELSDLITKKKAARDSRMGGIISKLKGEVAELQADVQSLKKAKKKTAKTAKKKKK